MIKSILEKFKKDENGAVVEYILVFAAIAGFLYLMKEPFINMVNNALEDGQVRQIRAVGNHSNFTISYDDKGMVDQDELEGDITDGEGINEVNELTKQRKITIKKLIEVDGIPEASTSASTTTTNLPIKVILNKNNFDYSKVREDGKDIRFYTTNNKRLNHFMESFDKNGNSVFWVKIEQSGTSEFVMKYGETSSTYLENPKQVFTVFEDFTTGPYYSGYWDIDSDPKYNVSEGVLTMHKGSMLSKVLIPQSEVGSSNYNYEVHTKFKVNGSNDMESGVVSGVTNQSKITGPNNESMASSIIINRSNKVDNSNTNLNFKASSGSIKAFEYNPASVGSLNIEGYTWYKSVLNINTKGYNFYIEDPKQLKQTKINSLTTSANLFNSMPNRIILGDYRSETSSYVKVSYDYIFVTKKQATQVIGSVGFEQ